MQVPDYQQSEYDALLAQKREAGAMLFKHLSSLYVLKKLNAAEFCIACYWCDRACVPGANFAQMAMQPGLQTGKYQRALDRVLPPPEHLDFIQVPSVVRGTATRTLASTAVALVHESIEAEVREDPSIMERVTTTHWPVAYYEHPMVKSALRQGTQLPLPLFMYTDALRYTSAVGSHPDLLLGFWLQNGVSNNQENIVKKQMVYPTTKNKKQMVYPIRDT